MGPGELIEVGVAAETGQQVVSLARLAGKCALDGVVCSALETAMLRSETPDLLRVTPGIRLVDDDIDDQRRTQDPAAAIAAGADYLVVGRAVTAAADPAAKLRQVCASVAQAAASSRTA